MKKLKFLLMGFLLLPLALAGCSSSDSDNPVPAGKTLTTNVQLGGTAPVAAAALKAVNYQSAVVTLTLPDGTTYTMKDDGNGDYSVVVSNFPADTPFIVEAHAGDVVVKNFFTNLAEAPDGDLGITDPKTTLYTDLIAAYTGALDANNNFPTAANLLSAVQGATISLDFISLKEQVLDDTDTTYASVRTTYETTLAYDNVASGTSSELVLAADVTVTETMTQIEQGGITPPVIVDPNAPTDAQFAAKVVADVYSAVFAGDLAAVSQGLAETADGFLNEGMNKEQFIAALQTWDEWGIASAGLDFVLDAPYTGFTVKPGANAGELWVYIRGTVTGTDPATGYPVYDHFDDVSVDWGMLVKKRADGTFAMMGDQRKIGEIDFEPQYSKDVDEFGNVTTYVSYWGSVEESANYPIDYIDVTSTAFTGTGAFYHEPGEDSNQLSIWFADNNTYFPVYDSVNGWMQGAAIGWTGPLFGATMTYTVVYMDGTQDVFTVTLPGAVTPVYLEPSATVNADGSMTMSWTNIADNLPGGAALAWQSLSVVDDSQGFWIWVAEADDLAPSVTSIDLPANVLTPGVTYLLVSDVEDIFGRMYRSTKRFTYNP